MQLPQCYDGQMEGKSLWHPASPLLSWCNLSL